MPQELHEQVPVMKQVLHAMGIGRWSSRTGSGRHLGTLAKRAEKREGMDVSLVSGTGIFTDRE